MTMYNNVQVSKIIQDTAYLCLPHPFNNNAGMLTTAQITQIRRLQSRISQLESAMLLDTVMDVEVPSKFELPADRYASACTFQIDSASEASYGKFCALLGTGPIQMKAWLSSINKDKIIEKVEMTQELVFSSHTYAQPCPLCVGLAKLTVLNKETGLRTVTVIVVKFRKLLNNQNLNKLTEHEAENAVKTWKTEEIEDLFPRLYFIGQIQKGTTTWECIGTERMDEKPRDLVTKKSPFECWQGAYDALKRLHAQGYVHGDAHIGNFMVVPKDSHHPVYHPSRIIMIDQDSLMALPTAHEDKALRNLLIVCDLVMLFFWNNSYMTFYNRHIDEMGPLMDYISQKNPDHLLCIPYAYYYAREKTFEELRAMLKAKMTLFLTYNKLMSTLSTQDIYERFNRYFESPSYAEKVEKVFDKWYNEKNQKVNKYPQLMQL